MNAQEILRQGDPEASLKALVDDIRKNPADTKRRTFLFQLYCVLGAWDKAINQLATLEQLDPALWPMTQSYREVIRCESLRAEVFAGRKSPLVFGEPMDWLAWLIESLALNAHGNHGQASDLRSKALELASPSVGTLDGKAFAWLADADSRLGPVCEAIINGRYYWVPFCRIQRITVHAPEDLRDLVWVPVEFVWANEGSVTGFMPVRYPGSEASPDSRIRMAKSTDWANLDDQTYVGSGQRMWVTDQDEYALLDVREIRFDAVSG